MDDQSVDMCTLKRRVDFEMKLHMSVMWNVNMYSGLS